MAYLPPHVVDDDSSAGAEEPPGAGSPGDLLFARFLAAAEKVIREVGLSGLVHHLEMGSVGAGPSEAPRSGGGGTAQGEMESGPAPIQPAGSPGTSGPAPPSVISFCRLKE
jgi:hypothetical protein